MKSDINKHIVLWVEYMSVLGSAAPITTAVPGSVSLADVSWLPWLSPLSAPPDTAPSENAALCAAKDRNQPLQQLQRQTQQEGKYRHGCLLLPRLSQSKSFLFRCGVRALPLRFKAARLFKLQCPWKWITGDVKTLVLAVALLVSGFFWAFVKVLRSETGPVTPLK